MAETPVKVAPNAEQFRQTRAAADHLEEHLKAAIGEFTVTESPKIMRGMTRLSNLTQNLLKQMDAEADAAADEVQKAHDYAQNAIGQFRAQGAQIRKVADDVLAQLGQITNDPTEVSGA